LLNRLCDVPDIAQALLRVRAPGYREQAVVPLGLPFALLLDLKKADDTAVSTMPGKVAASWITMMSSGSPSSALVDGTKPQSWG
jgi:hypothetical protein